jgi:hypothetical protein
MHQLSRREPRFLLRWLVVKMQRIQFSLLSILLVAAVAPSHQLTSQGDALQCGFWQYCTGALSYPEFQYAIDCCSDMADMVIHLAGIGVTKCIEQSCILCKQAEEQERSRRLDEQLLMTERREFPLRILGTKCNHAGK